ncbi:IS630 family transposase [Nonomuraea fuscirosea]|uniref:IS630 family transposase n=1 Tax=Nonomuraea fuscirosea TaxID=1291556 RepID=UPI001FE60988|nr:IS630 family transposase [Nonomuraea fuscirosea]
MVLITRDRHSGGQVTQPVKVRRLTDSEGQKLQRIVRRGTMSTVRYRRAMILLASAGGDTVLVIARLVQVDEDIVRDVIHRFNEIGLACLDPRWAGGRPRLLSPDDEDFVAQTAATRPAQLGQPFTRWSSWKLLDYLHRLTGRALTLGREALRTLLARRGITFQRTKTWKEAPDPDFEAKLERIEYALTERPERPFAFDEFGPLGIRPTPGQGGHPRVSRTGCRPPTAAPRASPTSTAATPSATTCCEASTIDARAGVHTWAALKSIRAARPDGAPIYVILDNLSAHKSQRILAWAKKHKVELLFTPTYVSWANPIEAHFGPLRQFTLANSGHPNHTRPDPGPAGLPALAQRPRPPP